MIDAATPPYNVRPEQREVDSTPGLQLALDASSLRAEPVFLRTGRYWFRGNLTMGHNATLVGDGRGPYDPMWSPIEKLQGPTLLPTCETGDAFIKIAGSNGGIEDLIIAYPNQVKPDDPGVGTTGPRIYPPTIKAEQPTKLRRLYIPNAYEAIYALCGRIYIEGCHLNGYKRGIVVDKARDVVRVIDSVISVWHFGLTFPQPLDWWAFAHEGTAVTLRRADGFQMGNVLIFGKHIGILLEKATDPADPNGAVSGQFSLVNLDTVRHGVVASATEERVGAIFTNLLLGPYWDQPGHAIWLQRMDENTPARISVTGGSIRHQWATRPDGTDWAFRNDWGDDNRSAGQLFVRSVIGHDLKPRL